MTKESDLADDLRQLIRKTKSFEIQVHLEYCLHVLATKGDGVSNPQGVIDLNFWRRSRPRDA